MKSTITCREFEAFIVDYLEDRLSEAQRAVFNGHIADCEPCEAYLKRYQQTVAHGKAAFVEPDGAPPEEVPADLLAGVLEALKKNP